eukprot:104547-Chlamydomonas_euryale.AAC.1
MATQLIVAFESAGFNFAHFSTAHCEPAHRNTVDPLVGALIVTPHPNDPPAGGSIGFGGLGAGGGCGVGVGLGWGWGAAFGSNYIQVDPEFESSRDNRPRWLRMLQVGDGVRECVG